MPDLSTLLDQVFDAIAELQTDTSDNYRGIHRAENILGQLEARILAARHRRTDIDPAFAEHREQMRKLVERYG